MPKIFNTSWLAVILATVAFYMVGFVWYAFLFQDIWLAASGMTLAETEAMAEAQGAMMFVWGLLITLAQALGLLWVINLAGAKRMPKCLEIAFWLFLMIAAPLLTYACLYDGYSLNGILVDFGHILIGYLLMAAIYAVFRGKDAVDA
ncbi:MAG: DUF1761 domain-containing protein [Litorimonas sp.]